jgi:BMFP domain-containing protein YqiC
MIKPDPKILDDLTRVAGGALNLFSGVREQVLNDVKSRMDEMADRMDLVPREDFDRLKLQVQELQNRLDALTPTTKEKAATKKTTKPAKKKR